MNNFKRQKNSCMGLDWIRDFVKVSYRNGIKFEAFFKRRTLWRDVILFAYYIEEPPAEDARTTRYNMMINLTCNADTETKTKKIFLSVLQGEANK